MTPTVQTGAGHLEPARARIIWIVMIATTGLGLSEVFACATPFAALATLAAIKLGRRDMCAVIGAVWLANQAIGYGLLGYPWTWDSAAWGIAIGLSAVLALLSARGLSTARPAPFAISLPFVAAFAMFEFGLYGAGRVLPGSDAAFSAPVIEHVFLVNAASLIGMLALYSVVALAGRFHGPAPLAAAR